MKSTQPPSQPTSHKHSGKSSDVLRALADPTRQKLAQLLIQEELSVSELVAVLRLPQSTVSRHLKVLREAGLVADRRAGTTVIYNAASNNGGTNELRSLLLSWLEGRSLSKGMAERLDKVLARRKDEAIGFFERLANRWDELRTAAFGDSFAVESFLSLLPRDWTVLDVGAGTGFLLPVLAAHFENVIAVEPAHAMLECARNRVSVEGLKNVAFHEGDLETLPLAGRTCDLAIACLVMHHIVKPPLALAEMLRVLRPGGRMLLVEQEVHDNRVFHETMQDYWWGFTPDDLAADVSAAGFTDVKCRTLVSAKSHSGAVEAPGLYVIVAESPTE